MNSAFCSCVKEMAGNHLEQQEGFSTVTPG